MTPSSNPPDWHCPHCGEALSASFDVCWSCGTDRNGTPDPDFESVATFVPYCQNCGYMLFGITSSKCPECGTPFDIDRKNVRGPRLDES